MRCSATGCSRRCTRKPRDRSTPSDRDGPSTVTAQPGVDAAARLASLETVTLEDGLTDAEFAHVEGDLGFEFADDHRAFLAAGLPAGPLWPNWRAEGRRSLQKRLQLPLDGILFAVEWNNFWVDGWGP